MSLAERFRAYTFWPFFERLRAEAPSRWSPESEHAPLLVYITKIRWTS